MLALCGCIEEKQSATHVNFELISVMKDNSTYKAVVFIKSIERNKSIPVSAFLVKTKNKMFSLDSENVWVPGSGRMSSIETGKIFVVNLSENDGYFWIYPAHHNSRVLGYLLVALTNLSEKEIKEIPIPLKPPVFPRHSVAYKNGKLFLLDNTIFGKAGDVIDEFKEVEINETRNLSLKKGYSLKRIVLGVRGADVHEIVVAVHNNSGFWVEPGNYEQGAFLFAPIDSSEKAIEYLNFLMFKTRYSVAGRTAFWIKSEEELKNIVAEMERHASELGRKLLVLEHPPVNFTEVKELNQAFLVREIYYTKYPESIRYLEALINENGEVKIVADRICIKGVNYSMT
ncbi:hypothetical protein Ferp_0041 [Ferroglobus placidus DSM 10642]|uniref:Uncharacterized protein n=1 Tax=Ferroglobus placidus (strain DSM 10642 / AEDII12DO) TaxID=589924 RepID=D3S0Z7_FERPA|nr:hypothetical protein Ferp_0041 [Ferroglobus placidus DSM 10642]